MMTEEFDLHSTRCTPASFSHQDCVLSYLDKPGNHSR